jgi:hypothetical protein
MTCACCIKLGPKPRYPTAEEIDDVTKRILAAIEKGKPMPVRAKFKVAEFKSHLQDKLIDPKGGYGAENVEKVEIRTIVLNPVYGNGDPEHENTKFWNASPSGRIELGTVNPAAWQAFELGCEYYVEFTKAD